MYWILKLIATLIEYLVLLLHIEVKSVYKFKVCKSVHHNTIQRN